MVSLLAGGLTSAFCTNCTSSATEDAELLHQSPAVDFDGFLRHAKLTADLLI